MRYPDRHLLIDDLGQEHAWPCPDLVTRFGALSPGCDFPEYAVRNLGFIEIAIFGSSVHVRLRPLIVSGRAVAALLYWIAESPARRAALSCFEGIWHHEVCGHPRQLITRMSNILATPTRADADESIVIARRSMDGYVQNARHPFAPLLRQWLRCAGGEDLFPFLTAHKLLDRAMIAERNGASGRFHFHHIGRGIRLYGSAWTAEAVGRCVEDQPDLSYGAWVAKSCATVAEIGQARCELVLARVRRQDGSTPRWRYERAIMPWTTSDGRRLVVSVTVPDPGPGR